MKKFFDVIDSLKLTNGVFVIPNDKIVWQAKAVYEVEDQFGETDIIIGCEIGFNSTAVSISGENIHFLNMKDFYKEIHGLKENSRIRNCYFFVTEEETA